jgi:hypothetical protein
MKLCIYQDWFKCFLYVMWIAISNSTFCSLSLSLSLAHLHTHTHTHTHKLGCLYERLAVCWLLIDRAFWVPSHVWLILLHLPSHAVRGKMASSEKRTAPGKGICAKGSCFPCLSGLPGAMTKFPICRTLEEFTDLRHGLGSGGFTFPFKPLLFTHCNQKIAVHYVVL